MYCVGELVDLDDLADLDLDARDGVVPGADLRVAGVGEEVLERDAHDARLFVGERGEVALPAVAGASGIAVSAHERR